MKLHSCEVCGRELFKKNKCYGMVLCKKHMHQYRKYHKFLDNIQRTNVDLNDYVIEGDVVRFNTYNRDNTKSGEFIIDLEDIEKVKYLKWRLDTNSRVITGNQHKKLHIYLSRYLMGLERGDDLVVDHINGDWYDNRKSNLRVCTQAENLLNRNVINSVSTYKGVFYDKERSRWEVEIRYHGKKYHLKRWRLLQEAVYARYVAECKLFKEYRSKANDKNIYTLIDCISKERKEEIKDYVMNKLCV